jgi:type IV fimbrial biogenesis protein FimT
MNTVFQRGFNLIELMVGIAVLGVLLGVGVPSFTEMLRNNRLATQSNELVGALNFARSESLKRGIRVSACPANGNVCSGGTDWNAGILVFTDDIGTAGVLDAPGDELLQRSAASTSGFVAGGAASPAAIRFLPTGAEAAVQLDIYKTGCTGPKMRRIAVALTGRIGLTKVACP